MRLLNSYAPIKNAVAVAANAQPGYALNSRSAGYSLSIPWWRDLSSEVGAECSNVFNKRTGSDDALVRRLGARKDRTSNQTLDYVLGRWPWTLDLWTSGPWTRTLNSGGWTPYHVNPYGKGKLLRRPGHQNTAVSAGLGIAESAKPWTPDSLYFSLRFLIRRLPT
jgi:hypothetical protein